MIAASPGTPERSRYLAIFDPKSVRPHEVYAADISAADLNLDIINGSLRDAVDMLGEINPKPAVRSLQPAAVLVAITPEQEPTAMTKIFQAVIPKHLGLVDLDRDTTLAYGDDLVRYPMTTAHYTLGWSSPSGIADVLEEIYRQQSTTEYSRADYVKIIDRKPARSVHAGKSLREGERAQSASAEENQETQQETQWSFQRSSQWDTQHYIQCFYSATSFVAGFCTRYGMDIFLLPPITRVRIDESSVVNQPIRIDCANRGYTKAESPSEHEKSSTFSTKATRQTYQRPTTVKPTSFY